jgi:putative flippase GtrA
MKKLERMPRPVRYIMVGIINTSIDFLVLNLLLYIFVFSGHFSITAYPFFKAISFSTAAFNSFFMNKYWVFQSWSRPTKEEAFMFFSASVIGLLINTGIATAFLFLLKGAFPDWSPAIHANLAALCGTAFSQFWNYFSYKLVVFRKVSKYLNYSNE